MWAICGAALAAVQLSHAFWCGPDVPEPKAVSLGRDDQGIEHILLEEQAPLSLAADRAAAVWLVYPGFQPFPAAVGAFRSEVRTPYGAFGLCALPSVAARQKRANATGAAPMEGGVVLLSFDPAVSETPRFPLDPAFDTARKEGLLTPVQEAGLEELDRLLPPRIERLRSDWDDFRESPYVGYCRTAFFESLQSFYDPRPAFSSEELQPQRFFNRDQRQALRKRGHPIRGRCLLSFSETGARVDLAACPLAQLAGEWNRLKPETAPELPALNASPEHQHEEVERLSLDLAGASLGVAVQTVFALLAAIDGLEPAQ